MKIKILLVVLIISSAVSLLGAATVFYVFMAQKEKAVNTEVLDDVITNSNTQQSTEQLSVISKDVNNSGIKADNHATKVDEKVEPLNIFATGDINLGRYVGVLVERQPEKYKYPFLKIADIMNKGDIVFGNLEEPITTSTKSLFDLKLNGKIILKAKPEAVEGIKCAGFNLLSLANNHILDYYESGLFDTMNILKANNISFAGVGKNLDEARSMTIIDKKGLKIGLLAYSDMADVVYPGNPKLSFSAGSTKSGVAPRRLDYILQDIKRVRSSVDILIVSLHWGVEYSEDPQPSQIQDAHSILDQGADMIIGHHTHKFQGVEIYKGKPIFYSMGNLIFDQNDPECQQGYIMQMQYKGNKLSSLSGIPYKIIGKSQVVPQDTVGAAKLFQREIKISTKLNSKCHVENGKIVFDLAK